MNNKINSIFKSKYVHQKYILFSSSKLAVHLLNDLQFNTTDSSRCACMQPVLSTSYKASCLTVASCFLTVTSFFLLSSSLLEAVGIWEVADISEVQALTLPSYFIDLSLLNLSSLLRVLYVCPVFLLNWNSHLVWPVIFCSIMFPRQNYYL